jgi:hypothetical protein
MYRCEFIWNFVLFATNDSDDKEFTDKGKCISWLQDTAFLMHIIV